MDKLPIEDYDEIKLKEMNDHDLIVQMVMTTRALCHHVGVQNGRITKLEQWKAWIVLLFVVAIVAGILDGEAMGEAIKSVKP